MGKEPLGRSHEVVHVGVVGLVIHALVPVAQVERVIEQRLAIRAGVDDHGQHARGVKAGCRRVDHELADRYLHAVGAPVPDAEDGLRVGDHDEVDVAAPRGVGKRPLHAVGLVHREVAGVLGVHVALAVLLDVLGDGGVIDDGHKLLDVLGEELVEERPILREDPHEEAALGDVAILGLVVVIGLARLLLERLHLGRKQPHQTEAPALLGVEGCPLVKERVVEQVERGLHGVIPSSVWLPLTVGHEKGLWFHKCVQVKGWTSVGVGYHRSR